MRLHRAIVIGIGCVGLLGTAAGTARAQAVATSFTELERNVKPATTVSLVDDSGKTITGKLIGVSGSSVTLKAKTGLATFDESRVRELSTVRRNTGSGAAAGLTLGAGLGFVAMLVSCQNCGEHVFGLAAAGALACGGIGAGVGAALGSSVTHEQLVYRAPQAQAASKFSVQPFAGRHGGGVSATLRF